jgi:hypothetical protein
MEMTLSEPTPMTPSGSVPLIIGVTGHRNIPASAITALEQSVARVFKELKDAAPDTPMVLLSPLGEGADRLVAGVALSMGIGLISPLPLAPAEYQSDFAEPASKQEFSGLLQRAQRWFVVEGGAKFPPGTTGPARDRQYAQVGAFVVRHSHVLLALWDGKPLTLKGGTAQVVEYKLRGIPEDVGQAEELLDPRDVGPVYQIVTPRDDGTPPAGEPYAVVRHFPARQVGEGFGALEFARELAYINRFNVDAATWRAQIQAAPAAPLAPAVPIERMSSSVRQSLLAIEAVFRPADALAGACEQRSRNAMRVLFAIGLAAALCLQGGSQPALVGTTFVVAFLVLLGAGYGVLEWRVKKPDVQGRHLDYRALAEGLRVQYFWTLAHINDAVSRHYLRRNQNELGWVRRALQSCEMYQGTGISMEGTSAPASGGECAESSGDPSQSSADLLQFINENWISDQLNWFTRRIHQRQAQILRAARVSNRLLLIGVTFAVISPAVRLRRELAVGGPHHWGVVALLLVSLIPLIIAITRAASQVREMSRVGPPLAGDESQTVPAASGLAQRMRHRRWKLITPALLALAAVVVSALLLRLWTPDTGPLNTTTFLALTFIFAAASLHAYLEKQGLSMHVKQYSRMARLFDSARRAITQALGRGDPANASRLIVALGLESLAQNEAWLLLHRERPIDIHGI